MISWKVEQHSAENVAKCNNVFAKDSVIGMNITPHSGQQKSYELQAKEQKKHRHEHERAWLSF